MIQHLFRIGQAGSFNPDQVEVGIVRERRHLRDQVLEALATNAAAGDAPQLKLSPRQQGGIDIYRTKIVDDHRRPLQRHVGMAHQWLSVVVLPLPRNPEQKQGKRLRTRHAVQLLFRGITLSVAQMYRSMAVFFVGWTLLGAVPVKADSGGLGLDARQMIVCIAHDATSSEGTLQLFRRDASGQWQADGKPWPVLFGRGGLAWGRGLHTGSTRASKKDGDHRNPAGLFKIGMVLGYAQSCPTARKIGLIIRSPDRDAWIDDPKLADLTFNHLYTLPKGAPLSTLVGKRAHAPG